VVFDWNLDSEFSPLILVRLTIYFSLHCLENFAYHCEAQSDPVLIHIFSRLNVVEQVEQVVHYLLLHPAPGVYYFYLDQRLVLVLYNFSLKLDISLNSVFHGVVKENEKNLANSP
jgi:hypothetical protein